jgi:hypothetical protein
MLLARWILFVPAVCWLLLGFAACNSSSTSSAPAEPISDLSQLIPGAWENVSMVVTVNTYMGQDTSYSLRVPKSTWEEKMGIRPIRTTYDTSHRYVSVYKNLQDSIVNRTRGIWNTFGDTLMLIEAEATYLYRVEPHPDGWLFLSQLDWDGDGQADDTYEGVQKKLN